MQIKFQIYVRINKNFILLELGEINKGSQLFSEEFYYRMLLIEPIYNIWTRPILIRMSLTCNYINTSIVLPFELRIGKSKSLKVKKKHLK